MTHSQRGALSIPAIVGGIIVLVLILAGSYFVMRQSSSLPTEEPLGEQKNADVKAPTGAVPKTDSTPRSTTGAGAANTFRGEVLAGRAAPLLVFNQADYDVAVADGKLVVLYFYANWCPICRAEFPKAEAAFDQLTSDQVVGFRVNFNDDETDDSEVAMARKFGVPYQHTKVFVKGGQSVLKSPEEWGTQRYLDEIAKHL